jgi:hypothetical protein
MNSQETEENAVRDETAFRRDYPLIWFLTLVGPFALTAGVLFVIHELAGMNAVWRLVSTAFATFIFSASSSSWAAVRENFWRPANSIRQNNWWSSFCTWM